ncbi:hypothetical protein GCM10027037_00380 [Mucilaginibacter koreensis]
MKKFPDNLDIPIEVFFPVDDHQLNIDNFKARQKTEELDFLNSFIFEKDNVSLMYTETRENFMLLESGTGN